MELTSVRCNHCGAPLEIDADTRFVACRFCNSQLEVKRTDSSAFTEVVQELAAKTEAMAGNLKVIELQNEVERLDREWTMNKEQFHVNGRNGNRSLPSKAGGIAAAIFGSAFLIAWISLSTTMKAPVFFPIFGVVVLGALLANVVSALGKSGRFNQAAEDHQRKRAALLEQLEAARNSRD